MKKNVYQLQLLAVIFFVQTQTICQSIDEKKTEQQTKSLIQYREYRSSNNAAAAATYTTTTLLIMLLILIFAYHMCMYELGVCLYACMCVCVHLLASVLCMAI